MSHYMLAILYVQYIGLGLTQYIVVVHMCNIVRTSISRYPHFSLLSRVGATCFSGKHLPYSEVNVRRAV